MRRGYRPGTQRAARSATGSRTTYAMAQTPIAAMSARIPSGVVQVISRVIDDRMSLAQALAAPRVHMSGQRLEAETSPDIGWTGPQLADIRALGIDVTAVERPGSFSRVHAVRYDAASGLWYGAADPDWEGTARGPERRTGGR